MSFRKLQNGLVNSQKLFLPRSCLIQKVLGVVEARGDVSTSFPRNQQPVSGSHSYAILTADEHSARSDLSSGVEWQKSAKRKPFVGSIHG